MQKLRFPAMKNLDQLRSLSGSAKAFSFSSRQPQDLVSSGSFSNLKLTAEKLVKDQASMKTDLELANSKLKNSMEYVRTLEDKLQNACNENAKLRARKKEDGKLWNGLESKFSSTKTLYDQLTETLQHLASQVQDAEKDKSFFESKISTSSEAIDSLNQQMQDLCLRLGSAEENIKIRDKKLEDLKREKEQKEVFYLDERRRAASLIDEKDARITSFEATTAERKLYIENLNCQLEKVRLELTAKEDEVKLVNADKDKVENAIKELSMKYDKELLDCKKESKQRLQTVQEEHASLILSIRQEHENQELSLKAKFDEELRHGQIQAEKEMKERLTALRSEHDVQLKAFKCQYEDDCKKLQEELDLQRIKEERQRALLQLQREVMVDNPVKPK